MNAIINRALNFVPRYLDAQERKRLAQGADLGGQEKTVLAELEREGFHSAQDIVDQGLLDELDREAQIVLQGAKNAPRSKNKDFWSTLLPRDIGLDSVFVRYALQENILNLVSAYLGSVPILNRVEIFASFGSEGKEWQESQLWHQDRVGDSTRTMKLWVYLTDVLSDEQGPFTYLPTAASEKIFLPSFGRVTDEEVEAKGLTGQTIAVKGPRKSTFFIDTRACFHQGSRVLGSNMRVAYMANYQILNKASSFCSYRGDSSRLSRLQKLVVKNS